MQNRSFTLVQLATQLNAKLRGDPNILVSGLASLDKAEAGQIAFLAQPKYRHQLATTKAAAVLVKPAEAENCPCPTLLVDDPYLAFARVSKLFDNKPELPCGIHPTALIAPDAQVASSARIGAYAVIERGAQIGENVHIGAHGFIGENCQIGADGWLAPRVTLYHNVRIGERVVIQSGAVIGGEGFGFARDEQNHWQKIAQLGGVLIGDDVEIGANTCIDRGALSDTRIASGVKLDNQIMIAHNVEIGEHTAMAACCGISGSSKIGRHCMLAGGVGLVGHIEICDNVFISGMTMVTHSIKTPGSYSSGTAMQSMDKWKRTAARLRTLDDMAKRLAYLEKQLGSANHQSS